MQYIFLIPQKSIIGFGCFSEYMVLPANRIMSIPSPSPKLLPLLGSGLTASIALEQVAELKTKQTVLVTGILFVRYNIIRKGSRDVLSSHI